MIRKILLALVLVPVAIAVLALSVANRQVVTFSLDPFGGADAALSMTAPLFLLVLFSVLVGILIGGFAAWLRQGKWRRAARTSSGEAQRWRREAEALRARGEGRHTPPTGHTMFS